MPAKPVRVFIVFDHPLVRDGLRPQVGDEITDGHRVALFVRCPWRFRGSEFLETRIIPKRIEHWIEPE